jgi:hypothetical protein
MAATEPICFIEPTQTDGLSVRLPRYRLTPYFLPLWRYAGLQAMPRLHRGEQP